MKAADDAAKVRFFPPGIPILAILAGAALQWLWPLASGYELPAPGRYYVGAVLVVGSILALGLWSVVLFRRRGQNENPWKPTPHIEIEGPFRVTRNPMYLQMVLVCIGFAIMLSNLWIALLTPLAAWLLYVCAIKPEEAYLEAKFGEDYLRYKKSVRRWL